MKKSESCTQGRITPTRKRMITVILAFLLFLAYLIWNLLNLQYIKHDYYEGKVYDQITTTATLRANRGNIYDSNMNLLATTNTVWRVFLSTRDIKKAEKETGVEYSRIIAFGLASILDLDPLALLEKIKGSNQLDVTVKKSVTKEEYNEVLKFITESSVGNMVFTEAQSSRYYPEGTLAAHVLGFCGSDNQGLYGLEYYYDAELRGKDGSYLYAKDANGNALNTEYSTYIPAEDGLSLVTTIDSFVQETLESQLQQAVTNHSVTNRATGIVMDTKTGAILAMATSSPFNPNSPYVLDSVSAEVLASSGYSEGTEEYKALKRELLEVMWSNKAVSETYEPGSTFKIITVSAALDLRIATMKDTFNCIGYHQVGGWRIRCHKTTGHGSGISLAYGLQMSCNPTMMQLAEKVGRDNFYSYVEKFGYLEKTGIDLPSEASTIFHDKDAMGSTELATASFGQRFKVSVINHITAIASVANGGELLTPYIVSRIIDSEGNTVYEHEKEVRRKVLSEDIAKTVSTVLAEGVSGDGGAKNARVNGYEIAAKTGTSQKFDILDENGNSYLRIGSTVAYNISDDGGIAVIIVVDEPQSAVKYGSMVAAPYVSAFLESVLPYLEYESSAKTSYVAVPNLVGMSVNSAKSILKEYNIKYEIVGDGNFILSQSPQPNDVISVSTSTLILYTTEKEELVCVPNFIGKDISEATRECINSGLNIKIKGCSDGGCVVSQSLPLGAHVTRGCVIELTVLVTNYED